MGKRVSVIDKFFPRPRRTGETDSEWGLGFREADAAARTADVGGLAYPTHHRLLSAREEVILAARARQGDESARRAMMEANIRLVMSMTHDDTRSMKASAAVAKRDSEPVEIAAYI